MAIEEIDLHQLRGEDLERYLPGTDCRKCGEDGCDAFAIKILEKVVSAGACPHISKEMAAAMDAVCALEMRLEESDPMMTRVPDKLLEMNSPDSGSPVVLTSSSIITIDILTRILQASGTKAFIVPMDTMGYTVDNSVHENTITQMGVMKAMSGSMIGGRTSHRTILLPGLAKEYKSMVERISRWTVVIGPLSGFELPLFLLKDED